jgi:hypothetical protein
MYGQQLLVAVVQQLRCPTIKRRSVALTKVKGEGAELRVNVKLYFRLGGLGPGVLRL